MSGLLILLVLVLTVVFFALLAHFYSARLKSRRALKQLLNSSHSIRNLTPHEKLRIKDFFDRETQTRYLEGYQNKSGPVGDRVFKINGRARQHEFRTIRGVIYTYQTIAGIEMLVPTAAMPFLKNENNAVEFVMVGNVALVIRLNDEFELGFSSSGSGQPGPSPNIYGDANETERLQPLEQLNDYAPLNARGYLQSIKGDRLLLVSDVMPSDLGLKFMLAVYWFVLFALCGLAPLTIFAFGIVLAEPKEAMDLGWGMFLYLWPFGELILWTLPFVFLFWIVKNVLPIWNCVLVLDRGSKQVLFSRGAKPPVRVDWQDLYGLVETAKWMSSYGYSMQEAFLELASGDRDCSDRVFMRLPFSNAIEAHGMWRALQEFMDGDLQTLTSVASESASHSQAEGGPVEPGLMKKGCLVAMYWLLAGPLPGWLTESVKWLKQQFIWRKVSVE
ncbi:MAG: Intracellular growth attenuator protein IgaA [Marinobacter excellens HL-55]|uniref:Intracellular growth attenuator protein IgaA n=1 Tax=Marinobacter excellens HL-55 TaxID=1305731 RepID=A0A0P8CTF1_9GAMM|nr:MAG: Intracellular growth attenuator protein IgaA [Marinobacter excellens HL-55]